MIDFTSKRPAQRTAGSAEISLTVALHASRAARLVHRKHSPLVECEPVHLRNPRHRSPLLSGTWRASIHQCLVGRATILLHHQPRAFVRSETQVRNRWMTQAPTRAKRARRTVDDILPARIPPLHRIAPTSNPARGGEIVHWHAGAHKDCSHQRFT